MDVVVGRDDKKIENTMIRLIEGHCNSGLFTNDIHLAHPRCDDLEKFCSKQVLDGAPY